MTKTERQTRILAMSAAGAQGRQTPSGGATTPAPAAGDGQGGAARKKNDGRALDHFLTASSMIASGDRPAAVVELRKGIRIAGPNLRADLEQLLAQVERNLAAEARP